MTYSEKIVKLRKANGYSQEVFAKLVGVSRQAVYKWEAGQSYPEAEKLIEIKKLFGIKIDDLLDIKIDDLLDDSYEVVIEKKPTKKKTEKKAEKPAEEVETEAVETAPVEEKAEEKVEEKPQAKAQAQKNNNNGFLGFLFGRKK